MFIKDFKIFKDFSMVDTSRDEKHEHEEINATHFCENEMKTLTIKNFIVSYCKHLKVNALMIIL